jgi:plastocyanin
MKMRHFAKLGIAGLQALLGAATCAHATEHIVDVGGNGNSFSPANTFVSVGDTVTFRNAGGEHNVASIEGAAFAFRCGEDCGANGGPSAAGWSSTITIPQEAAHRTIGYYCERHGFSMSGTLTTTNPVDLQTFLVE